MSKSKRNLGCHAAMLASLLLAACAVPEDPISSVAPLAGRLPDKLEDLQRIAAGQVATTPPSLMVRYRNPQTLTTATVILRQGQDGPLPDGAESLEVQAEISASTLAMMILLGNVPVARIPDYGLTPAGEAAPALRCTTVLVPLEQQAVRRETVCATGLNGALVKVHISGLHPRDQTEAAFQFFSTIALRALFALRMEGAAPAPIGNGPVFHL